MSSCSVSMSHIPAQAVVPQTQSAPPSPPTAKGSDGDRDGSGSAGSAGLLNVKA